MKLDSWFMIRRYTSKWSQRQTLTMFTLNDNDSTWYLPSFVYHVIKLSCQIRPSNYMHGWTEKDWSDRVKGRSRWKSGMRSSIKGVCAIWIVQRFLFKTLRIILQFLSNRLSKLFPPRRLSFPTAPPSWSRGRKWDCIRSNCEDGALRKAGEDRSYLLGKSAGSVLTFGTNILYAHLVFKVVGHVACSANWSLESPLPILASCMCQSFWTFLNLT